MPHPCPTLAPPLSHRRAHTLQVDLVPGGSTKPVTFANRLAYARAVVHHRLTECDVQVAAIRRGFGLNVPTFVLAMFTAAEMEFLVCGSATVDVKLLKATCE